MFAVFKSGGKQHRVSEGEVVRLELIDAEPGASLTFDEVLGVTDYLSRIGWKPEAQPNAEDGRPGP